MFAGFGDDGFIASEQIDIVTLEELGAKEQPEQSRPGDDGDEKALHGAIAGAVASPARDAEHGDAPGHGEQGRHDTSELTDGGQADLRPETQ